MARLKLKIYILAHWQIDKKLKDYSVSSELNLKSYENLRSVGFQASAYYSLGLSPKQASAGYFYRAGRKTLVHRETGKFPVNMSEWRNWQTHRA